MGKIQHNEYGLAELLYKALHDYENGYSMAKACRNYGLDYVRVLNLMKSENFKRMEIVQPVQLSEFYKVKDGYELIYDAVFDIPSNVVLPPDYRTSIAEAMQKLTDREQEILRERYFYSKTLEEVAEVHNVTRERIRQIEAKAIRKLRYPETKKMLSMGLAQYEREKLKAQNAETEAKVMQSLNRKPAELSDKLLTPITEMDLSVRSYNCLTRAGKKTLADIATLSDDDLFHIRNMGRKSVNEIRAKINALIGGGE